MTMVKDPFGDLVSDFAAVPHSAECPVRSLNTGAPVYLCCKEKLKEQAEEAYFDELFGKEEEDEEEDLPDPGV